MLLVLRRIEQCWLPACGTSESSAAWRGHDTSEWKQRIDAAIGLLMHIPYGSILKKREVWLCTGPPSFGPECSGREELRSSAPSSVALGGLVLWHFGVAVPPSMPHPSYTWHPQVGRLAGQAWRPTRRRPTRNYLLDTAAYIAAPSSEAVEWPATLAAASCVVGRSRPK